MNPPKADKEINVGQQLLYHIIWSLEGTASDLASSLKKRPDKHIDPKKVLEFDK